LYGATWQNSGRPIKIKIDLLKTMMWAPTI
jgi:hypothetical protein